MMFLNRQTKTVEKSAILIGVFTLLSSLLGIFRNSLLASYLGATRDIDIYYASFRIPDFIFNIFIMGAITAGFIPLLSKYIHTQKDEVNDFVNAIINFILITSLVFGVLLAVLAGPVIGFLFKGLDVQSKLMIASMTRVMMLQPIILGFSAILGNILLVHDFVFSFALAPLLYNLGIIVGIIFLYPRFGMMGLAYGVILGAILNLLVKFVPMKLIDIKLGKISIVKMKKYFKEFSYLILPRTLSIINIQIFMFVVSYFVSFLSAGKLGIFNLANSFQDLPQTIFAVSIATAAFPVLSRMYHQNNLIGVKQLYIKSLHQINFTMLLTMAGFLVLKYPLVKILLHYGNFSLPATQSVANILYIMTFGIIFSALLLLNLDTLFSWEDTKTPLVASFVAYTLGSIMIAGLYQQFDLPGIALSMVIANSLYCLIMMWQIVKKLKIDIRPIILKFAKNLSIAVLSGIMGLLISQWLNNLIVKSLMGDVLISILMPTSGIVITYWLLAKWLKFEEIDVLTSMILKKFKRP